MLCQACGADVYKPAAVPAATRTVAVYRDLPDALLKPCDKPAIDPAEIRTDVDLMGTASQLSAALDRCADQVDGIRAVYQRTGAGKMGIDNR